MRLYYRAQTGRPLRVAWELEELGVDYETVKLTPEECREAGHLSRQPLGRVPAVEFDDGEVLFDSTAVVLAIADRHPDSGLIGPLGSPQRNQVYAWAMTAMTELEPAAIGAMFAEGVSDEYKSSRRRRVADSAEAVGRQLADQPFLLGDTLTAADIVVGGVLALFHSLGGLADAPANVTSYTKMLGERPAFAAAVQRVEPIGLQ